jgi:chromosome segregation ATPase
LHCAIAQKLFDCISTAKDTFQKSLASWEKEKNEFVAGMAQLREKMMVNSLLPANAAGEENAKRIRELEESLSSARAELREKQEALDATRSELDSLRRSSQAAVDNQFDVLHQQMRELKTRVERDGGGGSDEPFSSDVKVLRDALDGLKRSMVAESDEAARQLASLKVRMSSNVKNILCTNQEVPLFDLFVHVIFFSPFFSYFLFSFV